MTLTPLRYHPKPCGNRFDGCLSGAPQFGTGLSASRSIRPDAGLCGPGFVPGTPVPPKRIEPQIQGPTRGHEPLPDVTGVDSTPRHLLDVQDVLQEGGHAEHADAAPRFVGQWMQFAPFSALPSLLHFCEVARHLFLEQIQDAANHGIVALEHLLEVIEVIVH